MWASLDHKLPVDSGVFLVCSTPSAPSSLAGTRQDRRNGRRTARLGPQSWGLRCAPLTGCSTALTPPAGFAVQDCDGPPLGGAGKPHPWRGRLLRATTGVLGPAPLLLPLPPKLSCTPMAVSFEDLAMYLTPPREGGWTGRAAGIWPVRVRIRPGCLRAFGLELPE